MNKAEAFLKEYRSKNRLSIIYNKASLGGEIAQIMEAYHQSRVNAISDEDIENEVSSYNRTDIFQGTYRNGFNKGSKWFKEQLLKQ